MPRDWITIKELTDNLRMAWQRWKRFRAAHNNIIRKVKRAGRTPLEQLLAEHGDFLDGQFVQLIGQECIIHDSRFSDLPIPAGEIVSLLVNSTEWHIDALISGYSSEVHYDEATASRLMKDVIRTLALLEIAGRFIFEAPTINMSPVAITSLIDKYKKHFSP